MSASQEELYTRPRLCATVIFCVSVQGFRGGPRPEANPLKNKKPGDANLQVSALLRQGTC